MAAASGCRVWCCPRSRIGSLPEPCGNDFLQPVMPAYTTVDLRTGLNYQNFTFELYAKNVVQGGSLTMFRGGT